MISYVCDVCSQTITERFVVVIDSMQHDLCKACKAKTVGKVKNGRAVAQPAVVKQIEYVPNPYPVWPYYWQYTQPTWVGLTSEPYPEPAKIWCGDSPSYTITTTSVPNSGYTYSQGNVEQKSCTFGYIQELN